VTKDGTELKKKQWKRRRRRKWKKRWDGKNELRTEKENLG